MLFQKSLCCYFGRERSGLVFTSKETKRSSTVQNTVPGSQSQSCWEPTCCFFFQPLFRTLSRWRLICILSMTSSEGHLVIFAFQIDSKRVFSLFFLQYNKHLFVHIGQTNHSYSDALLESVDIRQIYDKFPEKKGGLKELYSKGPQNSFFLIKFWVSTIYLRKQCSSHRTWMLVRVFWKCIVLLHQSVQICL